MGWIDGQIQKIEEAKAGQWDVAKVPDITDKDVTRIAEILEPCELPLYAAIGAETLHPGIS